MPPDTCEAYEHAKGYGVLIIGMASSQCAERQGEGTHEGLGGYHSAFHSGCAPPSLSVVTCAEPAGNDQEPAAAHFDRDGYIGALHVRRMLAGG
jgi:hypothetical protein